MYISLYFSFWDSILLGRV